MKKILFLLGLALISCSNHTGTNLKLHQLLLKYIVSFSISDTPIYVVVKIQSKLENKSHTVVLENVTLLHEFDLEGQKRCDAIRQIYTSLSNDQPLIVSSRIVESLKHRTMNDSLYVIFKKRNSLTKVLTKYFNKSGNYIYPYFTSKVDSINFNSGKISVQDYVIRYLFENDYRVFVDDESGMIYYSIVDSNENKQTSINQILKDCELINGR